jgi:hypothetical protein
VTQTDVDNQGLNVMGFCNNPFGVFGCLACQNPGVNPGDLVCSPICVCAPMPPICGSDAGTDALDESDAMDESDAIDESDAGDEADASDEADSGDEGDASDEADASVD